MNELKEQITSAIYDLCSDKSAQGSRDYINFLIEQYTDKKCLEALEQVSFDMYDINDLEWGIPTKWSVKDENDNHADLWIPQESAVEKIQYRINQLSTEITNKEWK